MSQREVIIHWMLNRRAERHNMKTDGSNLYSYGTLIAGTYKSGKKFVHKDDEAKLSWSQKRHMQILQEEFGNLANALNVDMFLQERLSHLQDINVKFKDKGGNYDRRNHEEEIEVSA